LRAINSEDDEFLFSVYASSRTNELELINWSNTQKETFLRMQFTAQYQYYIENYPSAKFQVIVLDGQSIGRLYVDRRVDQIRIMDITLLPNYQRRGIGSSLLNSILEEGAHHHLPVTIHVERFNPALHLYERLGFHLAEDKGVYYFMKWLPTIKEQHEHIG